ncbi:DUF6894 family protein [Phenylobacterium sp.]|jgi:hypothetical protein|uniref:DUF6894 family protein n=1 Tax=Phenylobacterium sp. TaxID=1871053 RepID=UPI003783AE91
MPRYFFHSRDGETYRDPEGVELPDAHAARREAIRFFAELMAEEGEGFWATAKLEMTVTDDAGAVLVVLTLVGVGPAD